LQGFDAHFANHLLAFRSLLRGGGGGIIAPFPGQISDFIDRTDMGGGIAMAIQTETHAQGFRVLHFIHLIDLAVTFHATDAAGDMDGVIEINEIRQVMDLYPDDGFAAGGAIAHEGEARVVFEHLVMTVHTGGGRREIGVPGFFDGGMAVTAIEAELADVDGVGIENGLDGFVTDLGVFGRAIIPHAADHCGADNHNDEGNHQRKFIGPLWENRRHLIFY